MHWQGITDELAMNEKYVANDDFDTTKRRCAVRLTNCIEVANKDFLSNLSKKKPL
jgi:hypothetical protein